MRQTGQSSRSREDFFFSRDDRVEEKKGKREEKGRGKTEHARVFRRTDARAAACGEEVGSRFFALPRASGLRCIWDLCVIRCCEIGGRGKKRERDKTRKKTMSFFVSARTRSVGWDACVAVESPRARARTLSPIDTGDKVQINREGERAHSATPKGGAQKESKKERKTKASHRRRR